MRRHRWRTRACVVLMLTLIPVSALWAVDLFWKMHEPAGATSKTEQMKTVCVGRFLIDVPVDAQVTLSQALVDGFNIFNYGGQSGEDFNARVLLREAEINAENGRNGRKNMESVRNVHDAGVEGKIFVFGFSSGYLIENGVKVVYSSVSVDGFVQLKGITFRFFAKGYKPEDVDDLERLLKQFQVRDDGIIPTQPGFCLDGALVRDSLTMGQGENIVMFAGLPGHEDLGIVLSTIAGKTPGPGLIERTDANRVGPYAFLNFATSTLLKGHRTINGLEGDEFAFKARERNLTTGYAFDWETQGTGDNVLRPFVSLELQTGTSPRAGGEPVQSSLSEASLGDLWRRMSSSLRLHSGAATPAPTPAPPR